MGILLSGKLKSDRVMNDWLCTVRNRRCSGGSGTVELQRLTLMMHIPVARRVLYLHYQAADAGLWPEISGSTQRSWRADQPAGWLDVLNMSQTLHTHTQRERERERTPVLTARRCHMRVRPTGAVLRTTTTNRPHPPEFHIPHAGAANDHLRRSREMDWVSIPAQNQTALSLNMA